MEQFKEMDANELELTNGGVPWVPILIIGGGALALGLGIYNGYKSTRQQIMANEQKTNQLQEREEILCLKK